jgi:hypothetical protein
MQNLLDDGGKIKAADHEQPNWVWVNCTRCDAEFLPRKPISRYSNRADSLPDLCGFCAPSTAIVGRFK